MMQLNPRFLELELQLLHTDFSGAPEKINWLLAPEFAEINPVGERVKRIAVERWLLEKSPLMRWQLIGFHAFELSPECVQTRYKARRMLPPPASSRVTYHSSIWALDGGHWRMCFHQSTPCKLIETEWD